MLFEEAQWLIELHYDDDRLKVDDLSQKVFTSRRQLQRAFAEAGTSVQERLHTVRMERSAELLQGSSLTVAQVARSVGYRQPAQFAKAFRRYYQLSPSEWRNVDSTPTNEEVISVACQCGCTTSASAPSEASEAPPRLKRDERKRALERRLQEVDRRLQLEEVDRRLHEMDAAA